MHLPTSTLWSSAVHAHLQIACFEDTLLDKLDDIKGVFSGDDGSELQFGSCLTQTDEGIKASGGDGKGVGVVAGVLTKGDVEVFEGFACFHGELGEDGVLGI